MLLLFSYQELPPPQQDFILKAFEIKKKIQMYDIVCWLSTIIKHQSYLNEYTQESDWINGGTLVQRQYLAVLKRK